MTAPAPPPQQAPAPAPVFALPVADAAAAWAALQETGTVEVGGKTITSATVTRPGKANVEDCGFAPTTDLGNAQRMKREFGSVFMFNKALGWMHWDGTIWAPDDSEAQINLHAQRVPSLVRAEAHQAMAAGLDKDVVSTLYGWSKRSQGAGYIKSAKSLFQPHVFVPVSEIDAHSRLVTLENGVLDLDTRVVRDFDPALRMTKKASVAFDPAAKAPFYERTMEYFVPDAAVRQYLQRLAGYCLTSEIGEQIFAVFFGKGANGKSTILEAWRQVMGDHSVEVSPQTFEPRRAGSGAGPDPERMRGSKLVTTAENTRSMRMDASFIKSVTGGEAMTARGLYADTVAFKPTFKIIMATNHEPSIDDDSEGMWRRVHKVNFDVRIPDEHRQPWEVVRATLAEERSGILNWMLDGYDEWTRIGLAAPPQVTLAAADMRLGQDRIGLFMAECLVAEPSGRCLQRALWDEFQAWRKGDLALSGMGRNEFYQTMKDRLGPPDSHRNYRGWRIRAAVSLPGI